MEFLLYKLIVRKEQRIQKILTRGHIILYFYKMNILNL